MAAIRETAAERPARRRALALAAGCGVAAALAPWRFARAGAAGQHIVKPWPAERPVPALELLDLGGKPWQLASAAGKVVVINFWATWCEPCRTEMPSLMALAARQRKAGLVVVTVNYKEPAEKIRAFIEKIPIGEKILLDPDGDATVEWTPRVFPSTVVVGRDGKPVFTVVGAYDWIGEDAMKRLAPLIAAAAKKKPGSA